MPFEPKGKPRPWITKAKPFSKFSKDFNYQTRQWRELSLAKRRANPLCEECERNGLTVVSVLTDHITPISKGGDPWGWDNLQALCRKCHDTKTGKSK